MPFPAFLKPHAPDDLVRIGSAGDGGYVLPARVLGETRGLLSMGLSDEWDFEADVYARTGAKVVVFDHSVDRRFWARRIAANLAKGIAGFNSGKLCRAFRFLRYRKFFDGEERVHIRRAIGRRDHGAVDIPGAIEMAGMQSGVLLKIDIEGWEYRILDQIADHRDAFVAIAIEFHDTDLHLGRIRDFLTRMEGDFALVHFHANNCTTFGPDDMTIVFELSLMRRELLRDGEELTHRPLPITGLDAPNLPDAPDIRVEFV